jgi:UMF1 family MFS transporter
MKFMNAVKISSWALFDLASKFFTLNLISIHFARWVTIEKGVQDIFYSLSFGLSMAVVALLAPFSGRTADITGKRKMVFTLFTVLAAVLTAALYFVHEAAGALVLFAFANLCFQLAVIMYNALIADIVSLDRMGFVSGLGKMFGFTGAIGVLYLMKPIAMDYGYHALFLTSGGLLLIFSLPCIFFVRPDGQQDEKKISAKVLVHTWSSMISSFRSIRQVPGVVDLLKAGFFVFCPLTALTLFMAVYLTRVFGFDEAGIINVIAVATLFAIGGSLAFGFLSDRIGYKKVLYSASVLLVAGFILLSVFTDPVHAFWLAALFGSAYGIVMTVPRPMAVSLVPKERVGEFFGLFALTGYAAALVGPLFWGAVILLLEPLGDLRYRAGILLMVVFVVPAIYYFSHIPGKRRN